MTDESFNISENWQSPQDAPDALFRVDQVLRSRSSAATRTAAHPSLAIASCSSPASFIETCGTITRCILSKNTVYKNISLRFGEKIRTF